VYNIIEVIKDLRPNGSNIWIEWKTVVFLRFLNTYRKVEELWKHVK
jgi:hypothetical protein